MLILIYKHTLVTLHLHTSLCLHASGVLLVTLHLHTSTGNTHDV